MAQPSLHAEPGHGSTRQRSRADLVLQALRHEGEAGGADLHDVLLEDLVGQSLGAAQGQRGVGLGGDDPGEDPAVLGGDDVVDEVPINRRARIEDIVQEHLRGLGPGVGDVRPDGDADLPDAVARGARLAEDLAAAGGVAVAAEGRLEAVEDRLPASGRACPEEFLGARVDVVVGQPPPHLAPHRLDVGAGRELHQDVGGAAQQLIRRQRLRAAVVDEGDRRGAEGEGLRRAADDLQVERQR